MNINEFVNIIETNNVLIFPFGAKKPNINRSVLPHFIPEPKGYKMGQIIYGSEFPDIYTTICLEGTVFLKHSNKKYPDTFKTNKFENYQLFAKGKPVEAYKPIYVSAENHVIDYLRDQGVKVGGIGRAAPDVYMVFLDNITFNSYLQNRVYDFENICGLLQKEIKYKAAVKVYKWYLEKYSPPENKDNSKGLREKYDPEFVKILNENGITDKGFNWFYKSKKKKPIYEIKMKGFSNLPKVEDVVDRIKEMKEQTTAGKIMMHHVVWCNNNSDVGGIKEKLKDAEDQLLFWKRKIREFKYGMWLEGKWFEEFEGKGDQKSVFGDIEFNLVYNGE